MAKQKKPIKYAKIPQAPEPEAPLIGEFPEQVVTMKPEELSKEGMLKVVSSLPQTSIEATPKAEAYHDAVRIANQTDATIRALDDIASGKINIGFNAPIAIARSAAEGLVAGVEKGGEAIESFKEGDIALGTAQALNSIVGTAFSGLTAVSPALQAFTAVNQIGEQLAPEITEWANAPISKALKPETELGKEVSAIGDVLSQFVMAYGAKGGKKVYSKLKEKYGKKIPEPIIEQVKNGADAEAVLGQLEEKPPSEPLVQPIEKEPLVNKVEPKYESEALLKESGLEIENKDVKTEIIPDAEKQTSDLPSLEETVPKTQEIPKFESTNQALEFARNNKDNADIATQLETKYNETRDKFREAMEKDSPEAESLVAESQLYKEALDEIKKPLAEPRIISDDLYSTSQKNLLNKGSQLSSGFDPTVIKDLTVVGAYHLENIIKSGIDKTQHFAELTKKLVAEYGDKIKPYLIRAWNEIKSYALGEKSLTDPNTLGVMGKPTQQMKVNEIIGQQKETKYREYLEKIPDKASIEEAVGQLKPNDVNYSIFKSAHSVKGNALVENMQEILFDAKERSIREDRNFIESINPLIKASRDSRGKLRLFKNDEQVFDYLEDRTPEKFSKLMPEEQVLARKVQSFFDDPEVQKTMTKDNVRSNYSSHIARPFWEQVHYDGFIESVKNIFKEGDQNLATKILSDLEVSKEKFNPFSKNRTGQLTEYTKDIGIVLDAYSKIYHIKKNLEPYRTLTKTLANVLGESGLPKSELFLKRYIKNVMGEKIDTITPEFLRTPINALTNYTGLRFLGFNLPAGVLNTVSGLADNLITMNLPEFGKGIKRFEQSQGQKILKQQDVVDFADWQDSRSMRHSLGKLGNAILFMPMRGLGRLPFGEKFNQGMQYLGYLTKEEFKSGNITEARHREITEKIASTHGSYRETLKPDATRYKLIAPVLQFRLWTGAKVGSRINRVKGGLKELRNLDLSNLKGENTKNLRSLAKEAAIIGTIVYLTSSEDDNVKNSWLAEGLQDLYSFIAPERIAKNLENVTAITKTMADIVRLGETIATDKRYKVDSKYGKKGESQIPPKLLDILPLRNITKKGIERDEPEWKQKINDKEKEVKELKSKALETKTKHDIFQYQVAEENLANMKKYSKEYQSMLKSNKKERERENKILNKKKKKKISYTDIY